MHRRSIAAIALAGALSAVLAGCGVVPTGGDVGRARWLDAAMSESAERPAAVGTVAGYSSPAASVSQAIEFETPVHVYAAELRCFGGGTMTFDLTLTQGGVPESEDANVVCSGVVETIMYSDLFWDVEMISVTASRPGAPAAFIATLLGEVRQDDPWAGYYTEELASIGAGGTRMAGSFGPPGDTSPTFFTDGTTRSGPHMARIRCAGATRIWVSIGSDSDPLDDNRSIVQTCDTVANYPVISDDGITVMLDSRGEPGAFMIELDPED
ncbi:hypothetical protein [Microbacterium terricola]|uniref:META domain-containing protein n=1 Tax=Microbacterium terricola TaxID=344163 RepID=A0ABM8DWX9_9MICO|nr:hypothetical protein [Microbacterium terricola]UYK39269.1 hypothetical protein OAU46_11240 [Microbacterium terricola]BDV30010.1 hypothetical protein Microterr_06700 [Microbacterium terricola]